MVIASAKALLFNAAKVPFLRATTLLAVSSAAGQAVTFLATPLLTRLYDPGDFAALAVFSGLLGPLFAVSALRYEQAIPITPNDRDARWLVLISLVLTALTALTMLIVVAIFGETFARIVSLPSMAGYLYLLPPAALAAGGYRVLSFWALRQQRFGALATTRILQNIVGGAIQIVASFVAPGAWGLLGGYGLSFGAGAIGLARGFGRLRRPSSLRRGIDRVRGILRRYARFPKFDAAAALLDAGAVQLPSLLIAALFNPLAAGVFFLAERMLTAPANMIGQAVGQVMLSGSREALSKGEISTRARRLAIVLLALGIVPTIGLCLAGPWLFSLIFGEEWRRSGVIAGYLVFGVLAQLVYSSVSPILSATNGQRKALLIHLSLLSGKVAAIGLAARSGDFMGAVLGIAVVNVVGLGLAVLLVLDHGHRYQASIIRESSSCAV